MIGRMILTGTPPQVARLSIAEARIEASENGWLQGPSRTGRQGGEQAHLPLTAGSDARFCAPCFLFLGRPRKRSGPPCRFALAARPEGATGDRGRGSALYAFEVSLSAVEVNGQRDRPSLSVRMSI